MKQSLRILLLPCLLVLSSCFGINADITLNQNGSGIISLEYHISKALDSLSKLDGNERWNTIPVGKADFERTLDRLPEMKLLSFSSKENEKDLVINAKMEFASMRSLLAFLDASGRRSSFTGDTRTGSMVLTLNEGSLNENAGLDKLIATISEGYSIRVSVTFPDRGKLSMSDRQGKPLATLTGSEIRSEGKTVYFSFPLYAVLSSVDGINAEFRW